MGDILKSIAKIYSKADETGVIMSDTVLLACGCTSADIKTFANHGIKEVPAVLEQRVKIDGFSDENLITNLFKLEQEDLNQLPISFYADIAKSQTLKNFSRESQLTIFGKIFRTIGIENFEQLRQVDAEKVACNHKEYKAIFESFFALGKAEQAEKAGQRLNLIVHDKLEEMVQKAPELNNNPEKLAELTNLSEKHNGNLMEASEEVLGLFEDTKELKKENIQALGLDADFEQYSVNTAKAVLAQNKINAYLSAKKALKGYELSADAENENTQVIPEEISLVGKEKDNPVNKFVNAAANTMANFAKPQNLAKIGFRTVATKAIQHATEGAIPGIGAAVGLAMKLAECGKQIFKDKRKASEVLKEAAPDLVRGVVTVGTSFTPLAAIAGPIGTVASIATRGIQGAHQEGLKLGHGFLKRVFSEFKKKGNAINLASSVLGSGLGFAGKEFMEHMNEAEAIEAELINETQTAPEMEVTNGAGTGIDSANGVGAGNGTGAGNNSIGTGTAASAGNGVINDDLQTGNVAQGVTAQGVTAQGAAVEPTLSYVEQYIKDHPGAHLDKNGWLQNADGSYARNDKGQLFGSEERVFRNLRENEILDKHGNIVEKVTEPEVNADFNGAEQQRPGANGFKNERHAERYEEMLKRDDRAIDSHNAKIDEIISKVDSEYIREQMEANEAKAMQDFENRLEDRYREIAADGEVTQREAMGLTKERNEFLREREQNLRNAIKENGYDKNVNPEEVKYNSLVNRENRSIERHMDKINETINKVDSEHIRNEMMKSEMHAMDEYEKVIAGRHEDIMADGKVTQAESMRSLEQQEQYFKMREQRLQEAIKANGYDTQPTKATEVVKDSVIKGYDDPTVVPSAQTIEETVSQEISSQEPTVNQENVIQGYQDPTIVSAATEVEKAVEIEPHVQAQFGTREAIENAEKAVDVEIEEQVKTEPLTVRSPEELAKIDELAKKAADARNFNSLPEKQQRELINIKAKAIVAQEQGDQAAYQEYKNEFDGKFKDYVAEDKRLDEISRQANIRGTSENQQRESLISYVSTLSGEQQVEGIRTLTEKYGMDMGDGANGVRQYVRYGGSLKMEVPEVPDKNLLEQGYTQQADGTWLKENKFGSRVVTDVNQNGIQDAGDLYTEKTSFAGFSSETSGHIADYEQEKINPQYNAQTALDEAVARERTKLNIQQQDQGLGL